MKILLIMNYEKYRVRLRFNFYGFLFYIIDILDFEEIKLDKY